MTQLHDLTALQQAAAVAAGEVSAGELVDHYLDRINRLGDNLGAFTTVTPDRARTAAAAADAAVRRSRDSGERLPPLHGVPLAIKDLTATAGVPTSFGSAAYAGFVPAVDDDIVGFLAAAGTISLGKTNTPEFGLCCYTENRLGPPARSPHDLTRMAGGSSGGAAAAVAAGLLPFAHGTDGGGSIRIPAAMCGLVGLKTSRGLISRGPFGSDPIGMSVHGPLARTTADAAVLLAAMQTPTPTLSEPFQAARSTSLLAAATQDPPRRRIGRTLDTPAPGVIIDPEVRRAYDATTALLADLGHEIVEIALPEPAGLMAAFEVVWAALTHGTPLPPDSAELLLPLTRHLLERGAATSGPELIKALGAVLAGGRALARAMADCDAVLLPTVASIPPLVGYFSEADPAENFQRQIRFAPWPALFNITGQPAINVPVQWTDAGLPIGVQLVGWSGGEADLLALCGQLERARPWAHRKPHMW